LAQFNQSAQKCASAKKHVFDSEGTVAGKSWKTYALCIGVYVFSLFDCGKIWLLCFFQAGI